MRYAFPSPVRLRSSVPVLMGLRHDPFVNIDGEAFAKPTLNGFWRINMDVVALDEAAHLALSAFITAMSGAAECVLPVGVQYRPTGSNGRRLNGCHTAPEWSFDHAGFAAEPFDGFRLRAAVSHRDSYIDIDKPSLSQIRPGHYLSLADRLYQAINVTHLDEHPDRIRVSVMPNIRGDHPANRVVIVDQLRLRCRMESGDQIGLDTNRFRASSLTFIEAFG